MTHCYNSSRVYTRRIGSLLFIGIHKLGRFSSFAYYRCVHCSTEYPVIGCGIFCNGREIFDCSCTMARDVKTVQTD